MKSFILKISTGVFLCLMSFSLIYGAEKDSVKGPLDQIIDFPKLSKFTAHGLGKHIGQNSLTPLNFQTLCPLSKVKKLMKKEFKVKKGQFSIKELFETIKREFPESEWSVDDGVIRLTIILDKKMPNPLDAKIQRIETKAKEFTAKELVDILNKSHPSLFAYYMNHMSDFPRNKKVKVNLQNGLSVKSILEQFAKNSKTQVEAIIYDKPNECRYFDTDDQKWKISGKGSRVGISFTRQFSTKEEAAKKYEDLKKKTRKELSNRPNEVSKLSPDRRKSSGEKQPKRILR